MDYFCLLVLCLSLSASIFLLFVSKNNTSKNGNLPPGPRAMPIIGNLVCLKKSLLELEPIIHDLKKKYGPTLTLRVGSSLTIFISDPKIIHKALIENGVVFASRPTPSPANRLLSCDQHTISSASYGSCWRILRRNVITEVLNSSRVRLFADGRKWVLGVLIKDLYLQSQADGVVVAMQSFQFAMFCILALMCYGEKLSENAIREIQLAHMNRTIVLYSGKLNVFSAFPWFSKYLFKNRWNDAMEVLRNQTEVCRPLIKARREHKKMKKNSDSAEERYLHSYLDSLLDINLSEEEGRSLTEDEIVALCAEFLNAGTDTTWTTLQWIMAELVIHQDVQERLLEEIIRVGKNEQVREEDLHRMSYLKAVVLEALRRHPPAHFLLPHSTSEEVKLEGYVIPENTTVNFMVAEMQRDENVWEEPLEFRPERFLDGNGELLRVDITGRKEIRMMPFGAGRRICPGMELALLHLEYYVANLVWEFDWKAADGEEVDLSEKSKFTTVMKNPLRARLIPRRNFIT